jgi:hypothetical protein
MCPLKISRKVTDLFGKEKEKNPAAAETEKAVKGLEKEKTPSLHRLGGGAQQDF